MKKIYFISAIMMLVCTAIMAQQKTSLTIPRPSAPGVEFSNGTPVKANRNLKKIKKAAIETAEQVPTTLIDGDVAGYTPYDTLLLTGYATIIDGTTTRTGTYTYDEYGHRKLVTTVNNGNEYIERYTYTVGAWNYWTSRLIEIKSYYSDEWCFSSKEERVIDSNRRLSVQKIYDIAEGTGNMYLYREKHFDHSHGLTDDEYDRTSYGYCVKDVTYNSDGSIYSSREYTWFQPAQNYVLLKSQSEYNKKEATFGSDYVTYKSYSITDNGTAMLEEEETHYFGNKSGVLQKYYSNGELSYAYGEYYEKQPDTPSKGYTTLTYYQYGEYEQKWQPASRSITSGMIYDEYGWQEQFKVNYSIRTENYYDGEWYLENSEKGEWLSNNILKTTTTYDEITENVYYAKYDEKGELVGGVTYNADGSYIVETYGAYDETANALTIYYTYYDASGKELRTIARKTINVNNNESETAFAFYLKEGDKLTPLTDYETTTSYGVQTLNTKYTFTAEGMPLSIIYYISDNDQTGGKYALYKKTAYEYTANGYKKSEYYYYYRGSFDGTPVEMLDCTSEYYLLDNGTYQYTSYEYEEDGTINYGSRTEDTKDMVRKTYSYNTESKTFVLQYKECLPIETKAADGTITRIDRTFDENDNIVNIGKSEEYRADNKSMSASYYWDTAANKWVGSHKSYREEHWNIHFSYSAPVDPTTLYNDEYLSMNESHAQNMRTYSTYIDYEWDYETDSWIRVYGVEYDFDINDNIFVSTHIRFDRNFKETTKTTITGNPANGLYEKREEVTTKEDSESNEIETTSTVYTYKYNANNILSEETIETTESDGTKSTKRTVYEYTNSKVYPTNITEIETDGETVQVSGLAITAADDAQLALYTANGAKVAEAYGTITAPQAGMYIVKCNGKAFKVTLK